MTKGRIYKTEEILNTGSYDLFLRNDSVFLKPYMEHVTYFLDLKKLQWIKTKDIEDIVFEDERFLTAYIDFGEWGYAAWFIDKITGKEYALPSAGTIINKLDDGYYITTGIKILKITDPTKLPLCEKDAYYEVIRERTDVEFAPESDSLIGAEIIYKDTTASFCKDSKIYVATSFVIEGKLYHLCIDNAKTYIARLENGRMLPVKTIGKKLEVFDWMHSDRFKVQKDGSQLLKFNNKNRFGFIEIKDQEIGIHYLQVR